MPMTQAVQIARKRHRQKEFLGAVLTAVLAISIIVGGPLMVWQQLDFLPLLPRLLIGACICAAPMAGLSNLWKVLTKEHDDQR